MRFPRHPVWLGLATGALVAAGGLAGLPLLALRGEDGWVAALSAGLAGSVGAGIATGLVVGRMARRIASGEGRFARLFQSIGDPVAIFDLETGRVLEVNDAALALYGYARSEWVGQPLEFLSAEPAATEATRRALAVHGTLAVGRRQHRRKDGTVFPVEITAVSFDLDGRRVGCTTLRDITVRERWEQDLVAAKEAALAAARAKDQFLANVSHEIRTPLNGVIGLTRLLAATELSPVQAQHVRSLRTSGEALLGLLNDLLDLAKIEADRVELAPTPVRLRALLHDVTVPFRTAAAAKQVALTVVVAAGVPPAVEVDSLRLRQVLSNLVANAVKFTPRGRVQLLVAPAPAAPGGTRPAQRGDDRPARSIQFSVVDTGIGIDPARRARIFQPFSQADASTTREYGGTGLGLAISQKLVGLMGGRISLESEVGVGSTFSFVLRLPLVAEQEVPEAARVGAGLPAEASRSLRRRRLHAAEDNAVNREVLAGLLDQFGLEADFTEGGREALQRWRQDRPDILLLDCQMPGLDGYTVAQEIRRIEAAKPGAGRCYIIAVTAHGLSGDREKCLAAGMDDYLPKPIEPAALLSALEQAATVLDQGPAPAPRPPAAAGPGRGSRSEAVSTAPWSPPAGEGLDEGQFEIILGVIARTSAPGAAETFLRCWDEFPAEVEALARLEPPAQREAAHRIKGTAANYGLTTAVGPLLKLEREGAEATPDQRREWIQAAIAAHAAVSDSVRSRLQAALADARRVAGLGDDPPVETPTAAAAGR